MKVSLGSAAIIVVALTSGAAAAQGGWQPMVTPWDLGTGAMAETAYQNMIFESMNEETRRETGEEEQRPADAGAPTPAAPQAQTGSSALAFTPSAERRRANLAAFADKTRQQDAESGAMMDAAFADGAVIDQMDAAMAPFGYSAANLGDAYAMWWQLAWKGAHGDSSDPTPGQMRAVQAQAHRALLAAPELAGADDAQKQQMAEAMLIQALMIEQMIGAAQQQPAMMPQVQAAVLQGARASGLELDRMELTESGFVQR